MGALGVNGIGVADEVPGPGFAGPPKLTVQQAALIQGFPSWWKIEGRKTSAYRQVGNAFPLRLQRPWDVRCGWPSRKRTRRRAQPESRARRLGMARTPSGPPSSIPAPAPASSPGVRSRMQLQRSHDTAPERELRSELHARGFRFRLHRPIVKGTRRTVDIVFPRQRVAVDVRGCFWHGHPHEFAAYERRTNLKYWSPKIEGNSRRDLDTERRLSDDGWTVVVVWECEPVDDAADRVSRVLRPNRSDGR